MKGADFTENISCSLCRSYLIDAVTLTECIHSFCRSCLLDHLSRESRCPKCACDLGSELSEVFYRDDTLQKVVYKMVPDVYWEELRRRGEFYSKRTISDEEKVLMFEKNLVQLSCELCAPSENVSLCIEYVSPSNTDEVPVEPMQVDDVKPTTVAEADRVEKFERTVTSFKRYFRCSAATTIGALRKLLEAKLEVCDTYRLYFVDTDCNSVLEDCCTLQDVAYMFAWKRKEPMKILFTLQRHLEEEKPPVLDMELMPELVAEEPIPPPSFPTAPSIDTPVALPALTVSLNTSMMEAGGSHQPIITQGPQPPPRKKRKPASPTKKHQPASPAPPIQRMTGISPLAKGPPPLARPDKPEAVSTSLTAAPGGKKTGGGASGAATAGGPGTSANTSRAKLGDRPGGSGGKGFPEPGAKHQKLNVPSMPTSFDNKLHQILTSSSSKSGSRSPSSTTSTSHSASQQSVISAAHSSTSSHSESSHSNTASSCARSNGSASSASGASSSNASAPTDGNSKNGNSSQTGATPATAAVGTSQANGGGAGGSSENSSTTQNSAATTNSAHQQHQLANGGAHQLTTLHNVFASGNANGCGASNGSSHPRPIQPRPPPFGVDAKNSYESFVKSYAFGGNGKLASFSLEGKMAANFASVMHMPSSMFRDLDPKIASQPIKQVLSGRGMSLMPDTSSYLRPPTGQSQLANFMQLQHVHMQALQRSMSTSSSPALMAATAAAAAAAAASNPSSSASSNSSPSQQSSTGSPAAGQPAQLKLPVVSTSGAGADAGKLSNCSSPVPKLQSAKIVPSLPIPTAHITPFMSQN